MKGVVARIAFWVAATSAVALAQDSEPLPPLPPPPASFPEQVVPPSPGFVLTDRVLFVVDVSGSMKGDPIRDAFQAVVLIMSSAVDDWRAGLIVFTGEHERWGGQIDCDHEGRNCSKQCVRPGWALMPARCREALGWLSRCPADGGTDPAPALHAALQDPTPRLTIVFVSDGKFRIEPVLQKITTGQAWRQARGLGRAGVMVMSVGPNRHSSKSLKALAKAGGGGMWTAAQPEPPPKPPAPKQDPQPSMRGPW